jgi:hypothetical protein
VFSLSFHIKIFKNHLRNFYKICLCDGGGDEIVFNLKEVVVVVVHELLYKYDIPHDLHI